MASRYFKRCSISLISKEMQIETTKLIFPHMMMTFVKIIFKKVTNDGKALKKQNVYTLLVGM
jgi:hypothetical protein